MWSYLVWRGGHRFLFTVLARLFAKGVLVSGGGAGGGIPFRSLSSQMAELWVLCPIITGIWPGPSALLPELWTSHTDPGKNSKPNFTDVRMDLPAAIWPVNVALSCLLPRLWASVWDCVVQGAGLCSVCLPTLLASELLVNLYTDLAMCTKCQGSLLKVLWLSASVFSRASCCANIFWTISLGAPEVLLMIPSGFTKITQVN